MHGERLIDACIAEVARDGWPGGRASLTAPPRPLSAETIADLRLPGDRPLPASLRRWLEFDAGWLAEIGWFASLTPPMFAGRQLGEMTQFLYGFSRAEGMWPEMFAMFEATVPELCLPLVGGSDSRRLLYLGEPDSVGEYPVLVTDIDDAPYIAVMYPGFDVYLAHETGVLELDFGTYTSLMDHPEYGERMRHHAERTGLGLEGLDLWDQPPAT